jgi:Holliday junction resolvase RusA-like endonuclease
MEDEYERSPVEDIIAHDEDDSLIRFFVGGEPQPKGSTRAYYVKKLDRVVTTNSNRNTKQWQLRVAMEAQRANECRKVSFYSPDKCYGYEVEASFLFQRPKSLPKKMCLDTKRPDLDKLIRAVLDGLANVIIPDDAQVISISSRKRYAEGSEMPGAEIGVRRVSSKKK